MSNKSPVSRMKLGSVKNEELLDSEVLETAEETVMTDSQEADTPKDISEAKPKFEDQELIKDLNLEQFYFTGTLEHEFKLKKLAITLRLMKSEELEETNKILWDLAADKVSLEMIMFSHAIEVIGRSITKYGKVDLSSKTTEERVKFVRETVPGIIIPRIARMYDLLEASANKAFSEDSDELKN